MAENWGQAWVGHIEAMNLDDVGLDRGRNYALSEWRLELEVDPGVAGIEARAGRRVAYRASLLVPVLSDAEWERVVGVIANNTAATAALLDGALDMSLLDAAEAAGVGLLPNTVTSSCDCRHQGALCRHVGAVVYLLGDAIEADPFELFRLRGRDRAALVTAVSAARGPLGEEHPEGTELATISVDREPGDLPDPPTAPASVAPMAPFPTDPPATAPFTAEGLRRLADAGAARALLLLKQ